MICEVKFPISMGDGVDLDDGLPWAVIGLMETRAAQYMMLERELDVVIRDCEFLEVPT